MIIFRRIDKNVPDEWVPRMHWYVEYFSDDRGYGHPDGIAFVTVWPRKCGVGQFLDFIFVADQYRREGVATKLLEACLEKWPSLDLGEAISDAGQGLLNKFEHRERQRTAASSCVSPMSSRSNKRRPSGSAGTGRSRSDKIGVDA